MKYHIFRRSVPRAGKLTKAYYYWYYDERGKRMIRSCGRGHRPCLKRANAEEFVRELVLRDLKKEKEAALLKTVAQDMFIPGLSHMERREQLGRIIVETTRQQSRACIEKFLLTHFGDSPLNQATATAVVDWAMQQKKSSSWKNILLRVLREVFTEAQRRGMIEVLPTFERFKDDSTRQSILSTEELGLLFDESKKADIWGPEDPDLFYTLFLLCVSAGLRLGEVRAFRECQFYPKKQALVVDRFLRANGAPTKHLKKGSASDPRIRVVLIPTKTCDALSDYSSKIRLDPQELFFQVNGHHVHPNHARKIFARALARIKIPTEKRKITPHALRYTYVTRVRRLTDTETVMQMAGHHSIAMADHYTRIEVLETVAQLSSRQQEVEKFFL